MSAFGSTFYVTGGTLRHDAPSYVERQADKDLLDGLLKGEFCYVLTSRQMGKSSLMVRTAQKLREQDVSVVVLDLTAIGQNLTTEQWYDGLIVGVGRQLRLEDELEDFWKRHQRLGPCQRLFAAISDLILPKLKERRDNKTNERADGAMGSSDPSVAASRLVMFVDELDTVRSLPFSTDEFFAAIRECYTRRTEDPAFNRLTFCLLGVATPSDLIRDTRTTPFNIGQRIELTDFTFDEALPLSRGLRADGQLGRALIARVYYWTEGHPYLTQALCQAISADPGVTGPAGVDRICEALFLSHRAREQDDNLIFVRERILRNESDLTSLLTLYQQVLADKPVADDAANPLVALLRLSGITRRANGRLQVRNRIYHRVFNKQWVTANMPDAELRRQRAAYRHGLWRATSIAGVIVAIMASLVFYARNETYRANEQRERADRNASKEVLQRQRAEKTLTELKRANYQANIQAADAYLSAHEVNEARRRLQTCDPELRNWEWKHLTLRSDSALRTIGNTPFYIRSFSLSPDGKSIALVEGHEDLGKNEPIKIFDTETGQEKLNIDAMRWIGCVAFSVDSQFLAAGSNYSDHEATAESIKVRVWKLEPFQEVASFVFPAAEAATCVTFDRTGKALLVGSGTWRGTSVSQSLNGRGVVRICEVGAENKIKVLGEHARPISFLAMTPDQEKIISCSEEDIKVWDAISLKLLMEMKNSKSPVTIHPKTKEILQLFGEGKGMQIRDLVSGKVLHQLNGHGGIHTWSISPDGTLIVTGSSDKTIEVWDLKKQILLNSYQGHGSGLESVAFFPDGLGAISLGEYEKNLKVWDITYGGYFSKLPHESIGSLVSVAFHPKGGTIITGDTLGRIKIWDAASGEPLLSLFGPGGGIKCLALSPDGNRLAIADQSDKITIWDLGSEKIHIAFKAGRVEAVAFSPIGSQLVSSTVGSVRIWNPETGVSQAELDDPNASYSSIIFGPDGKTIAAIDRRERIKIWDSRLKQLLGVLEDSRVGQIGQIDALAYHPSGRQIAGANGRGISIWDVGDKKLIAQLQGHESFVKAVAFSPDGTRLASGGDDGDATVRVWDLETMNLLLTLRGHNRSIDSIAFSPDGTRIASASGDKSVLIWETESPSTHHEARRTSAIRRRAVEPLVEKLFAEHLLMTNVIQLLGQNTSLSRDLREAAIRAARARGDNIEELIDFSWEIVRRTDQSVEVYQEALRRAKAVCTVEPIAVNLNTLGMAQYRVGQFEEAIATLQDAYLLNKNNYDRATDLLFIAMCHYRLGHFEEANARLVEARKIAKSAPDSEPADFLREAEALIKRAPN